MDYTELSDLEEGEILEYDSVSPSDIGRAHFGMRNFSLAELRKENKEEQLALIQKKNLYPSQLSDDHPNQGLQEKLKPNGNSNGNNVNISTIDLESISSDGECRSDEENKDFSNESKYFVRNAENKAKGTFYGTVEDIMSEIGETICRKSRCSYKKRKSRDLKQNLDKCSATSYDLWRREIFFCRLKNKRRKRKESFSDSNSDVPKDRLEKRKRKKKKKETRYEEEEAGAKKSKVRDFDEVRRNLLEKLKKQKAEQESKASANDSLPEAENSEIQEVDMVIDCTNYVDDVRIIAPGGSAEDVEDSKEKEGEDETDLVKLRLIALASNKKQKTEEVRQKAEKSDGVFAGINSMNGERKDADLDRNELLLRAEALKSALLKKHQKRLNRLKVKKPCEIGRTADSNVDLDLVSPSAEEKTKSVRLNGANDAGEAADGAPREKSDGRETESASTETSRPDENEMRESVQLPHVNGKGFLPKTRSKRKKSKSGSLASDLKENSEKTETLEDDDRTLRSQLLSDLMKKKSLKDFEKKTVLVDSAQTLANKSSPPATGCGPRTELAKPPAVPADVPVKKKTGKVTKSVALLKIPKPEIQRIIVHLGSDDSSDEDQVSPPAPHDDPRGAPISKRKEDRKSGDSNVKKFSEFNKDAEKTVRADYERSVELLLSQARKKIEGEKHTAKGTLATPEAVYKHLPPSQRLEYLRLKQKIAERERLKMRLREGGKENSGVAREALKPSNGRGEESIESSSEKPKTGSFSGADPTPLKSPLGDFSRLISVDLNGSGPSSRANGTSGSLRSGGLDGAVGSRMKEPNHRLPFNKTKNNLVGFSGKGLKKSVAPPANGLKSTVPVQRSTLLLPSSQALISKLKLLLKKIKIEKMIEENYGKEISKLRTQLSLFERKQSEQRFKIKKLGEESMKTYKAIQGITAKSNEKSTRKENEEKEKETQGEPKEEGKKPEEEEGKNVSDEPVTEIIKVQVKSKKDLNNDDKVNGTGDESTASCSCLLEYSSPLETFNKAVDSAKRVDPNVMICQFDLMGVCKDEECAYQHLRNS